MFAAAGREPFVERSKWSRRTSRCPSSLNQHASGLTTALLGDSAMEGWSFTRLPNTRVETEICDELLWIAEPIYVADRCSHTRSDRNVRISQKRDSDFAN
jgi:hypothetical protein